METYPVIFPLDDSWRIFRFLLGIERMDAINVGRGLWNRAHCGPLTLSRYAGEFTKWGEAEVVWRHPIPLVPSKCMTSLYDVVYAVRMDGTNLSISKWTCVDSRAATLSRCKSGFAGRGKYTSYACHHQLIDDRAGWLDCAVESIARSAFVRCEVTNGPQRERRYKEQGRLHLFLWFVHLKVTISIAVLVEFQHVNSAMYFAATVPSLLQLLRQREGLPNWSANEHEKMPDTRLFACLVTGT